MTYRTYFFMTKQNRPPILWRMVAGLKPV